MDFTADVVLLSMWIRAIQYPLLATLCLIANQYTKLFRWSFRAFAIFFVFLALALWSEINNNAPLVSLVRAFALTPAHWLIILALVWDIAHTARHKEFVK